MDDLAAMRKEFPQEHDGPDPRMEQAERVEEPRIAARKMQRHDGGLGATRQAHDLRRPDGIADGPMLQTQVGDLARRERQDAPAGLEMAEDSARTRHVPQVSLVRVEGIDLDQPRPDPGDLRQPLVPHHQGVGTSAQQEIHGDDPVGEAMRMIRHDDHRTLPRDAGQTAVIPGSGQLSLLLGAGEEVRPARG